MKLALSKLGRLGALLLPVLIASPLAGQAAPAADTVPPLKLTLDFGFVDAAGNTSLKTLNAGENVLYRANRIELLQAGSGIYGRTTDSTITEQLKVDGRVNFMVVKTAGFFVGVGYERNRFAGLARRFVGSAGLALKLVDGPMNAWSLELGASLNQEKSTLGASTDFTALRLATLWRHSFTKTAVFQETFEVLPNVETSEDLRINSETSLVAPLSQHVALKVSYAYKFDNLPALRPNGLPFEKSDRILTTGIQVVF
ncbi:MAG: DUF481 domain-containing protein [Gemmatimonadetes bacterium]|nr:DUF481 domain-containing protein [Gemmatimonadota bacterium]